MSSGDNLTPPSEECHDQKAEELNLQRSLADEVVARMNEILKWITKLREELNQNISQFHELSELKDRVEIVLKETERPFSTSMECRRLLTVHRGSEIGRDLAEELLIREEDMLQKRYKLISEELHRVNNQLTRLREVRLQIEADIQNKMEVLEKAECIQLLQTMTKENVLSENQPIRLPLEKFSTPTAWLQFTEFLINKSQLERNISQFLSIDVTREILTLANSCFGLWYQTNAALKKCIKTETDAKNEVERHLHKIEQDMTTLRATADDIRNAIDAKTSLLQAAESKVDARKGLPGIEICHDPEMVILFREIKQYRHVIDILRPKYEQMKTSLDQLNKTKAKLERDFKLKKIGIVDKEKCLFLRQSCPISTYQEARTAKPFEI